MDFFSDIGKKFSSAAKTVQKRTLESVEIGKLNSEMRSLKEKRAHLFKSLGEAYYKAGGKNEGNERIEVLVEQLDQIAVREAELQAQLDRLTQQKRCPKCGNVVALEARFCPACGERLPEEEKPAEPEEPAQPAPEYCVGCGALRQDHSRFCVVCGKAFDAAEEKVEMEINWPDSGAAEEETVEEHEEPSPEDVSEE